MQNIRVHRYSDPLHDRWQGFIEPEDLSWIMFVQADGRPYVFLDRDPETGAVISDVLEPWTNSKTPGDGDVTEEQIAAHQAAQLLEP